jgi:membrane-bound lytic murein transglycosylase MltF
MVNAVSLRDLGFWLILGQPERPGPMNPFRCSVLLTVATTWLLACVVIGLTACTEPEPSGSDAREEGNSSASEQVIENLSPPRGPGKIRPAWFGDLDEMVEKRLLHAVVTFSNTNYFLDGAEHKGISYEALKLFEKELNREFGKGHLKINLVIVPERRDRLIPLLLEGQADLALANLTITPERQKLVDFSAPVFTEVSEVVVTGPGTEPVEKLEDLSGREVVVRASSSYYESLRLLNRRFEEQGIAPATVTAADEHLEVEGLLEMVSAGLIPMTVVDNYLAEFWSQVFPGITVRYDVAVAEGGEIAWAFRKDSPKLKRFLDRWIQTKYRKGTLTGNILFRRYLRSTQWVEKSLSGQARERFIGRAGLFKKYGDRYGFDWPLLAALAYQESRLDHSLRSPRGAVGIMQLLPSTAADPNVGIPDIEVLENNIHAGAKYLAFLRDRYFSADEIEEHERVFFALAAYNAGPRRVAQLRNGAIAMELDPNVWFDNVEVVAAKKIGRETVQYVSNIHKYHVAYERLAAELERTGRL